MIEQHPPQKGRRSSTRVTPSSFYSVEGNYDLECVDVWPLDVLEIFPDKNRSGGKVRCKIN